MDNNQTALHIIANGTYGVSMSGGDRILIEMTRRWLTMCREVCFYVNEEGRALYEYHGLADVKYVVWPSSRFKKFGFLCVYLARIIIGACRCLRLKLPENCVVYSSSDFLPDSLPALALKFRYAAKIRWVAGFYLFAPNPFGKDCPYKGANRVRALVYYLSQFPVYFLIKRFSDAVCVTSEPDVKRFVTKGRSEKDIIVMRGGVDFDFFRNIPAPAAKEFDAVYIGRLHPQKGILELMDIWKIVMQKVPKARLAVIGDGPLERGAKNIAEKHGLNKNIEFFGFKDGSEKARIFKSSKIVVHPATYDSGGMASCEAMACGLPGISFDLESLKTYYPKGMLKIPCFDKRLFADGIDKLLTDASLYDTLSAEALEWARTWDWSLRAKEIFYSISGGNSGGKQ